MTTHAEDTFSATDGTKLYAQSWRPSSGTPKATLVMVHGLKDHGSRYASVAERLVGQGYAVHAPDLRGHAHSEGPRVYVDSFDTYVDDLALLLERVRKAEPGRPLFLFGHSMGGAIVTLSVLRGKAKVDGLLLSGPALTVTDDVSGVKIGAAKFFGALIPKLPILGLDDNSFSRVPAVIASMKADPLIYQKAGPARTLARMLGAMEEIQANMEKLTVPFVIMHGSADKLTNPEGSRALHQRAGATDKTLHIYDGLFHDVLHEPEAEQVYGDLLKWLEKHSAAAAQPAA